MEMYNLYKWLVSAIFKWVSSKRDDVNKEHKIGVSLKKFLNMSGDLRVK